MKSVILGLTLLAAIPTWSQNVPPRINPGLWEETITLTSRGSLSMPDSVLSQLTPEQRARVEARLKASAQPSTRTSTEQQCVTAKDIEEMRVFNKPDASCKEVIRSSTGTQFDGQWQCGRDGISGTGAIHFDILTPESARGTAHTVTNSNGHQSVTDSKIVSKWIGPDCGRLRE